MAEAAICAMISVLFKKLASPSLEKFGYLYGVKKDLKNLQSTFTAIQAVLKDAEEQQWTDNRVRDWLSKLKDVAYDLDNILDEFDADDLQWRVEIRGRALNKVRNFFTPSNPVVFYFKMARKIKKVVERLDVIAKERSNFNLIEGSFDRNRDSQIGERNQTHSFILESQVFGREEDREELVQMLVGQENEEDVSVVPIVGMGGLGKTTLAKLVYNDDRVRSYFDRRMWAFVSENFDMVEIVRAIIASANGEKCDLTHMDPLQVRLREVLNGKKYLLVLDDVWNENQEKWSELESLLRTGARGSKIIVTTRSEIVASIMATLLICYLEGLTDASCWALFRQRAFPKRDEEAYPNLVDIGKEIAKKCGGVPLAAKALGGMLHSRRRESEWLSVRDDENWMLKEDQILSTLRLSYNHLPSPLKQCFAFCSIFPKGRCFSKAKLCEYWIAQGFIQPSGENRQVEDISAEYFDELCWRSFFQEASTDFTSANNRVVFKMHDLISDLAKSVAEPECSTMEAREREDIFGSAYQSSFLCNRTTCIFPGRANEIVELTDKFLSLAHLRILDLRLAGIKQLPNSVGKLKHLRYLDLSYCWIETLPKSISTLWNLQVLKLSDCYSLSKLPSDLWKMISLRHLDISNCRLTQMPKRIGQLSCLQTLPLFIVGKERGHRLEELQGLNLQGKLQIEGLENVLNRIDAEKASLKEKRNLVSLTLSWKHVDDLEVGSRTSMNSEQVIEGLQPHSNIQKLHIENYMGVEFPPWLLNLRFPNLVKISLVNCKRCKILPQLSQLRFLKSLTIEGMPEIELWAGEGAREVTLPIEELSVSDCPKLTHIPHLPFLTTLSLVGCQENLLGFVANCALLNSLCLGGLPDLTSLPEGLFQNKSLLKSLTICYCPKLKSLPKDLYTSTSIEELRFWGCNEPESFEEEVRSNLKSLRLFRTALFDEANQKIMMTATLPIYATDKAITMSLW